VIALKRIISLAFLACTYERISDCTAFALVGESMARAVVCVSRRQRSESISCKGDDETVISIRKQLKAYTPSSM
jgi:hypothetical protein